MYAALMRKFARRILAEGEVMQAVIFIYLDLTNMTWSGKSQEKVGDFFIAWLLATLNNDGYVMTSANFCISFAMT